MAMNDLEEYFLNNKGRLIHKWHHYFEIYDRHFSRFRNQEIVVVEVGVFHGGSLQMWKNYFGQKAVIYGIDVDPRAKVLEEENIRVLIGSQSDRSFLRKLKSELPAIDIFIDDGGHRMQQQIITFEEIFDKVQPNGVYVCEDLLTSYQLIYGGGHRRPGTFIEYSKRLIDKLNAWHSEEKSLNPDSFTRTTHSLHYYDSMLVIEKATHDQPAVSKTGVESFASEPSREPSPGFKLLKGINWLLRQFRLPAFKLNR